MPRARRVIEFLWAYFMAHADELRSSEYTRAGDALSRQAADYIAGMTDHYAIATAERLGFRG